MDISTKIGIAILVWVVIMFIASQFVKTESSVTGAWILSTLVAIATLLIL